MTTPPYSPKIGIMGAGAIGCYVGGRLLAKGHDVVFVARPRTKEELAANPLTLVGMNETYPESIATAELRVATEPEALSDRHVVLVCVKSGETAGVGEDLARVLAKKTLVISLQNGVRNAEVLREKLPRHHVLAGIVGFNVVAEGKGRFRQATTGPLVIEASRDVEDLTSAFAEAGLATELAADIAGKQWTKLLMNLNNAVSALGDVSTPRLIFDPRWRRILGALIAEALGVMKRAGIRPRRIGPLPVHAYPWVLRLPTAILAIISRAQLRMDPEARSSMWQDLAKGRLTEVDHLNGEIVRLAQKHGTRAPLNERIVTLVHEAEKKKAGSPKLSAEALWRALEVT